MHWMSGASLVGCVGVLAACSTVDASGDSSPGSTGSAVGTDPSSASNPTAVSDSTPTSDAPGSDSTPPDGTGGGTQEHLDTGETVGHETGSDTDDDPPALGGPFLRGINFGYRNPKWGDPDMAWLAAQAGSDSARLSLQETHLNKWGYDIEVGDAMQYEAVGLGHHIAFLIAPIAEHSTAPQGTPDWELAHYIPKNLYEPAVVDGAVNPNNYWAMYVYKTVDTYKDYVDTWEIWNEPDWVADYNYTLKWEQEAPTAEQLVRFGGSIHDYVRMLRVSSEAAKLADPEAKIALGGIGYPSFLDAILRYTDEPGSGEVTPEFPATGAAYFDVLNYHYYPLWTPGSSDAGVEGFVKLRDELAAKMAAAGAAARPFSVTEVGAPRSSYDGQPGGVEYARNFYIKVMTRAQAEGYLRADWFALSDGDPGSAFSEMGLYEDVKDLAVKEDAVRTPTGVAARTHGLLLDGALFDAGATAGLGLPAEARGYAFRRPDDRQVLVLWAHAGGTDETAQAQVGLATDRSFELHEWDFSASNSKTSVSPEGGVLALELTGSPVFLVEL